MADLLVKVAECKTGLEAFDVLVNLFGKTGQVKDGSKPHFMMTREEFEAANTHYRVNKTTGEKIKDRAYISVKKQFANEQELADYVNNHIAKGKYFETQLGYHQSMTHFRDENDLTWYIDHNFYENNGFDYDGFSISAKKEYNDVIKEAVRNGFNVPIDIIKTSNELSSRILFYPTHITEKGVPVKKWTGHNVFIDIDGNELYSFDPTIYHGEPLLRNQKAILDSLGFSEHNQRKGND